MLKPLLAIQFKLPLKKDLISVNPYFQFEATVPEAGEFVFTWYDDDGSVYEKKKSIKIA